MERGLKLILIVAAVAILISVAFIGPKENTYKGNETSPEKTGFVAKILTDLDFTGGKTVADSITKSSEIRINVNPFGE